MPRPAPRRATAGARPAASPWTLLGDTHRALLAWPEGIPGAPEVRALRDTLAAHVRAVLCAHSSDGRTIPSRKAAVALGVSLSHLQRWCAKGGPLDDASQPA